MDAPAQLHSRSLDRGSSAASSDAGDERRNSGGSTGAAASALRQQLAELTEANRQLTAAIQEKDVLIEQLQARPLPRCMLLAVHSLTALFASLLLSAMPAMGTCALK